MKKLIKWAYFQYVYPDEVVRAYGVLDQPVGYSNLQDAVVALEAMTEREWIPNDRLH